MKWLIAGLVGLVVTVTLLSSFAITDPQVLCEVDRAQVGTAPIPQLEPLTEQQWQTARTVMEFVDTLEDVNTPAKLKAIGVAAAMYGSNLTIYPSLHAPVMLHPFTGIQTNDLVEDILGTFYAEVLVDDGWEQRPPADVVRWVLAEPGARMAGIYEQAALVVASELGIEASSLINAAAADPACLYARQVMGEIVTINGITWPVPGHESVTSRYGYRIHPIYKVSKLHAGVDIGAPCGSAIVPVMPGLVVTVDENRAGFGTLVEIVHPGGIMTRYAHMFPGTIYVREGDQVTTGQRIADVGSAGTSTACHLHIELKDARGAVVDAGAAFGWY